VNSSFSDPKFCRWALDCYNSLAELAIRRGISHEDYVISRDLARYARLRANRSIQ